MAFEEYLISKKIDSAAFRQQESGRWEAYKDIFEQVHPESFTTQKKFMINDLRRQYLLKEAPAAVPEISGKPVARPVMKPVMPKPAISTPEQIASSETEKPTPPEDAVTKKAARPVMRPTVKKAPSEETENQEVASNTDQPPLVEKPTKPARPVIKPVIKKPVSENPPQTSDEEKIVSAEEQKSADLPPQVEALKRPARPVIRPVIKKREGEN